MTKLDPKRLREILSGTTLAYIFGSFARGEADEFNDLDLLVLKETTADFSHRHEELPK